MSPEVIVIAMTQFNGVPDELLPFDGYNEVEAKNQDVGTDLERLIEASGRTCYDSYGKGRSSKDYHEHIKEVGHGSVTEHSTLTFFICNVSRLLTHELVRHRVGTAISQRSTRYVDESESLRCFHPLLQKLILQDSRLKEQIEEHIKNSNFLYLKIFNSLTKDSSDVNFKKQARGAARGILESSLGTELVWTVNIRELRSFLIQRASAYVDGEMRLLANAIYEAALPCCPAYLDDFEKTVSSDNIGYVLESKFGRI